MTKTCISICFNMKLKFGYPKKLRIRNHFIYFLLFLRVFLANLEKNGSEESNILKQRYAF